MAKDGVWLQPQPPESGAAVWAATGGGSVEVVRVVCNVIVCALALLLLVGTVQARISNWLLLSRGKGVGNERSAVEMLVVGAILLLPMTLLPASRGVKDAALLAAFIPLAFDQLVVRLIVWPLWAWAKGYGLTPLHRAVLRHDLAAAQAALESGVNIEAKAMLCQREGVAPGDTALHLALRREDQEMVRLLLEHGANPEDPDSWRASFVRKARVPRAGQ